MAGTQPLILVPKPKPDQVLMVVYGADGAMAYTVINEVIMRDSDLEQFLLILRDAQDKVREARIDAQTG